MSVRELNAEKRPRRCLRCGKAMWTDRCHRICTKCEHLNERMGQPHRVLAADIRAALRRANDIARDLAAFSDD